MWVAHRDSVELKISDRSGCSPEILPNINLSSLFLYLRFTVCEFAGQNNTYHWLIFKGLTLICGFLFLTISAGH